MMRWTQDKYPLSIKHTKKILKREKTSKSLIFSCYFFPLVANHCSWHKIMSLNPNIRGRGRGMLVLYPVKYFDVYFVVI